MRNRCIEVTFWNLLGFTVCQHLYSREIRAVQDEVCLNEINQLRREVVAVKGMFNQCIFFISIIMKNHFKC